MRGAEGGRGMQGGTRGTGRGRWRGRGKRCRKRCSKRGVKVESRGKGGGGLIFSHWMNPSNG